MDENEIEECEQNKPLKRRAAFKKYMGSIKKNSNKPSTDILKLAKAQTKDRLGQGLLQLEEANLDDKDFSEYVDDFDNIPEIFTVTRNSSSYSLTEGSNMNDKEPQICDDLASQRYSVLNLQNTNDFIPKQFSSQRSPRMSLSPQNSCNSENFDAEDTNDLKKELNTGENSLTKHVSKSKSKRENKQKDKQTKQYLPLSLNFLANTKSEDNDLKHFKQFEKDFLRIMEHDDEKQWKTAALPTTQAKSSSNQAKKEQPAQKADLNSENRSKQDPSMHGNKSNHSKLTISKSYFSSLPYRKSKRKKKSYEVFERVANDDQDVVDSQKKSDTTSPQGNTFSPSKYGNLGRTINEVFRPANKTIENDLLMQIFDQEEEKNWKVVILSQEQKNKMKEERTNKLKKLENERQKQKEEKEKQEKEKLAIKLIEEAESKTKETASGDKLELFVEGAYVVRKESDSSSDDVLSTRPSQQLRSMTQRFTSLRRTKSGNKTTQVNKSPLLQTSIRVSSETLEKSSSEMHHSTFSLDRVKSKLGRTTSMQSTIENHKHKLRNSKQHHRSTLSTDIDEDLSNKLKIKYSSRTLDRPIRSRTTNQDLTKNNDKHKKVHEPGELLKKAASLISFRNRAFKDNDKQDGSHLKGKSLQDNLSLTDEFYWNVSTPSLEDEHLKK